MSNKTPVSNAAKIESAPKPKNNQVILILLLLAVTVLMTAKLAFSYLTDTTVTINDHRINATVADSSAERAKGLGGKDKLAKNEGMLFKFDTPDYYCFWMKDMKFSIDMIWLDEHKQVVTVLPNVSPETYPRSFCPTKPAKYILEIQSGKAKVWQLTPSTKAIF